MTWSSQIKQSSFFTTNVSTVKQRRSTSADNQRVSSLVDIKPDSPLPEKHHMFNTAADNQQAGFSSDNQVYDSSAYNRMIKSSSADNKVISSSGAYKTDVKQQSQMSTITFTQQAETSLLQHLNTTASTSTAGQHCHLSSVQGKHMIS